MRSDDSITRWEIVPYFHGRVLDISEGASRAFPHFLSHIDAHIEEPDKLGMFAGQSFDAIVSSYLLHLIPFDECKKAIAEWSRVTKPGGHIVLHLPLGEHKWRVSRVSVIDLMRALGRGWDMVKYAPLESGILCVFKMLPKREHVFSCDVPKPQKTCGVVRLGAFGDMIQASSIFPWLKSQGYHITLYCSDHGKPVVEHDPHIDQFIVQGRDEVPAHVLGDFWEYERKKYDKWVNLSESVEGTLLPPSDSLRFHWPDAVRAKHLDVNYLEFTHALADVPPPYQARFYSTPDERAWARAQANKMGPFNVLWSLSGSSVHKHWPHLDTIIARFMLETNAHVVLVGDDVCEILESGWQRERRVHCRSGKWSIRESMAFAEVADLIIGCETGLLNAAGMMTTPKIVMLSHSSEEMLTKHWINATALSQHKGYGCSKQPCRQLHRDWSHCPAHETPTSKAALCMQNIDVETVWYSILRVINERRKAA